MQAQYNRFELENFSQSAAEAFLNGGQDLNDTITKQAQENDFTPDHIDRVVQNANIFVNARLVKQARDDGQDPRISFPLAKGDEVVSRMDMPRHKLAEMRKEAEVVDLFTVHQEKVAHSAVLDATLGKIAPDPYADLPLSVGHEELAMAMVKNAAEADITAKRVTAATLSHVCQTLETFEHRGLTDHSLAKIAMDDSETSLRIEIHDQLLSGCSPATLRDVAKHANLDKSTAEFIDRLVTKVASEIQAREGVSAFADGAFVNPRHSLIEKCAKVKDKIASAIRTRNGLNKFASAHKSAQRHYTTAVREGR